LNLFGLRGFFSLILGEENGINLGLYILRMQLFGIQLTLICCNTTAMDDTQKMMQMGGQMGGFGADPSKVF
jgi:hypothetical protein